MSSGMEQHCGKRRATGRMRPTESGALGEVLDRTYSDLLGRRRRRGVADPFANRPWVFCDLHTHTEHSHDCSTPVEELLDHAEALELGAIAVTDHNVFLGAAAAVELARSRDLTVIPGEEMKTDEGEVIGLFLEREIPQGMTMEETIAAIRGTGGDRLSAPPVRSVARNSSTRDAAPTARRDRRGRGLQRQTSVRHLQR